MGALPDLKSCAEKAARELDWLKANPQSSREEWASHIRGYVLSKFLLEEGEPEQDLIQLAQKSVSLLTGIPREKLEQMDRPSAGQKSAAPAELEQGPGSSLASGERPQDQDLGPAGGGSS